MQQDHSAAIWVLGLLLVLATMATSPYWQGVGMAIRTGQAPSAGGSISPLASPLAGGSGLMLTAGAFVLVLLLVGMAKASESLGALALVLLLALWGLFLLGHTSGVQSFFARFMPARPAPGGVA